MKYSLVELAPIAPQGDRSAAVEWALASAVEAEQAGYHRFWFGEHPGAQSYASHDPGLLIAAAAARTSRIRLGSGAVLLNHYSPFSVADRFVMLEAMAPGRIDLGLGRATAGPLIDHALKRDRGSASADDFGEQVHEIIGHLHDAFAPGHPFSEIGLAAGIAHAPDVFILGSSGNSAELAGRLGLGYAFGAHINPAMMRSAFERYRDAFRPTPFGTGEPRAILALNIVAADDAELAHQLTWPARALRAGGRDRPIPTLEQARGELSSQAKRYPSAVENSVIPPQIAGTTESLTQQLRPLVDEIDVDEIVVHDMLTDREHRRRSRELIAEALSGIRTRHDSAGTPTQFTSSHEGATPR